MGKEDVLRRLDGHQSLILEIMAGAEALLIQVGTRDTAGLARARWALMRALTDYQLFKHRAIFDPAIGGGILADAQRAARMKAACTAVGEAFRANVLKWSGTDVMANWTEYQPSALAMIARIRQHVAVERADVATLLAIRPGTATKPIDA